MEKIGIKETKEALVGVNELSLALISVLKDGFQFVDDMTALWSKLQGDTEVNAKMKAALENISMVPAEIKDLDAAEGVELAIEQAKYVPKIIDAFKKEESTEETE